MLTSDTIVAQQCRALRTHWQVPPNGELPMGRVGYNYRLADPLAALARESLAEFGRLLERRQQQTRALLDLVNGAPGITAAAADPEEEWNGYSALFRIDLPHPRAFSEHLANCGVPNSVGTLGLMACDQRPVFAAAAPSPCPNAARLINTTFAVSLTAMFDYETSRSHLAEGRAVIEGRSLHTVAIYQAVIQHAGEQAAVEEAREILRVAAQWRPLPDLTILITDDADIAMQRTEQREHRPFSADEQHLHHRAAVLYQHVAADDLSRMRILDRRQHDESAAVGLMRGWINSARGNVSCMRLPLVGGCLCGTHGAGHGSP